MKFRPLAFLSHSSTADSQENKNNSEMDDVLRDKLLTVDLFKNNCAELGYDMEIFTNREGFIYRFRRIPPKVDGEIEAGGVW